MPRPSFYSTRTDQLNNGSVARPRNEGAGNVAMSSNRHACLVFQLMRAVWKLIQGMHIVRAHPLYPLVSLDYGHPASSSSRDAITPPAG